MEAPEDLIVAYVTGNVPTWVDEKQYNECLHCSVKFKKGHQHHCRLCGEMFCSMCTCKYNIPNNFKQKDKKGPVRICNGCRDECYQRRLQATDPEANSIASKLVPSPSPVRPNQLITSSLPKTAPDGSILEKGREHIHPPEWVHESKYSGCFHCRDNTGSHPFHCRLCGEMFCSKCTVKHLIHDAFKRKKKPGPVRICFECRYKVKDNAKLDSRPYVDAAAKLLQMYNLNAAAIPHRMGVGSTSSVRRGSAAPQSYEKTVPVYKETDEYKQQALVELSVRSDDTLVEINEQLIQAFPALANRPFFYLCRGEPVAKSHWDIFKAQFFPEIIIAKGFPPGGDPEANQHSVQELAMKLTAENLALSGVGAPSSNAQKFGVNLLKTPPGTLERNRTEPAPHVTSSPKLTTTSTSLPHMHKQHPLGQHQPYQSSTGSAVVPSPMSISPVAAAVPPAAEASTSSPPYPGSIWVKAKFQYDKQTEANVSFLAGDVLVCMKHETGEQWWFGETLDKKAKGWFPAAYVEETGNPAAAPIMPPPPNLIQNRTHSASNESIQTAHSRAIAIPVAAGPPPVADHIRRESSSPPALGRTQSHSPPMYGGIPPGAQPPVNTGYYQQQQSPW